MRKLIFLAVLVIFAAPLAATAKGPATVEPGAVMSDLKAQAQARLDYLDRSLAQAAVALGRTGLTGPGARKALEKLLGACPEAIDVCAIDLNGHMVTIEPAAFRHLEESDISGQEQVQRLQRTRRPVMSQVFMTVEGVEAVDLEHPVMGPDGRLLGAASLLFKPDALLEAVWGKLHSGPGERSEFWAMDPLGRIIYDQDQHEVDRNLFSDPLYRDYPELLALGRRVQAEPSGRGAYSFFAKGSHAVVTKQTLWDSAGLHGTWWRLVVTRPGN